MPMTAAKCCSLSLCLSVHVHISKTLCLNVTTYSVHVVCGHRSVLLWPQRNKLRTSGFVEWDKYRYRQLANYSPQLARWRRVKVCRSRVALFMKTVNSVWC